MAYKTELDRYLDPDASTIVMSRARGDPAAWAKWSPGGDELEQVVARFNDPADPLKIIIVTAKLLTGFDAPILYCQYLDRPLTEHTLLQAITRTNRVYPPDKTHGLIVDYLGMFDDVAKSLAFDEHAVEQVVWHERNLPPALGGSADRLAMTWGDVARIGQRHMIFPHAGSHEAGDAIITDADIEREIIAPRRSIEKATGRPAPGFVYLHGDCTVPARSQCSVALPFIEARGTSRAAGLRGTGRSAQRC